MEFNTFVWDIYKGSPTGKVALSKRPEDFEIKRSGEYTERVRAAGRKIKFLVRSRNGSPKSISYDDARRLFENIVRSVPQVFTEIGPISLALYQVFPEHFSPYLYTRRFHTFQTICDTFGIALLPPPNRPEDLERSLYYLAINDALQEFRALHRLTPSDLVAFLYDFAPRVIAAGIGEELPSPANVWFAIGGDDDFDFLDRATFSDPASWQGSRSARRGDVVLMYRKAPLSHIESAWRVIVDGFADPFFYYHNTIWIDQCRRFPPIRIQELRDHPQLSQNGIVRRDFVGASGARVSVADYCTILSLLKSKGFDPSSLPIPQALEIEGADDIENEKHVEALLVEPLLTRLGYEPSHWMRQLPLRMGRGQYVYPDYALLARTRKGDEAAQLLVEAKRRIATQKQLEEAFVQAKSYALRLQSRAFLLAAIEGVWLFQQSDGFSLQAQQHFTWKGLEDADQFRKLAAVIDKSALTKR